MRVQWWMDRSSMREQAHQCYNDRHYLRQRRSKQLGVLQTVQLHCFSSQHLLEWDKQSSKQRSHCRSLCPRFLVFWPLFFYRECWRCISLLEPFQPTETTLKPILANSTLSTPRETHMTTSLASMRRSTVLPLAILFHINLQVCCSFFPFFISCLTTNFSVLVYQTPF